MYLQYVAFIVPENSWQCLMMVQVARFVFVYRWHLITTLQICILNVILVFFNLHYDTCDVWFWLYQYKWGCTYF